jgi:integrase
MARLKAHHLRQLDVRMKAGDYYQDQGFVFADEVGKPIHPNTLAFHYRSIIKAAGVPLIRIHDLRHTSATLMRANGEHPKIVQERLGHADVSLTLNRYSHVTMDMQREAADRLDKLIGG